ncbi:type III pantothenate kinase [Winogradskyella sp. A3E31]|uniref:type III pantothenate kinase n=1 Tax=Winogradskyella sp. A3E31 TaxID=3349637 RepID=UPI00398B2CD9
MNLIIDVGNSYIKLSVFKDNTLIYKSSDKHSRFISSFKKVIKTYPKIDRAIISSVGRLNKTQINRIKEVDNVLELNANTKVPFNNNYGTPKTLGVDRIALVSSAAVQYPNKNVLIIDAGSCITYDFLDDKNQYLGGAISPGIRMRYRSLNTFTANLPLLDTKLPENIIGDSTKASIHSGVLYGINKEIDGVIDEYRQKYPDLTVILTGGDAKLLSNKLKNSIFANSNFLLEGLNFILDYNSK